MSPCLSRLSYQKFTCSLLIGNSYWHYLCSIWQLSPCLQSMMWSSPEKSSKDFDSSCISCTAWDFDRIRNKKQQLEN